MNNLKKNKKKLLTVTFLLFFLFFTEGAVGEKHTKWTKHILIEIEIEISMTSFGSFVPKAEFVIETTSQEKFSTAANGRVIALVGGNNENKDPDTITNINPTMLLPFYINICSSLSIPNLQLRNGKPLPLELTGDEELIIPNSVGKIRTTTDPSGSNELFSY